MALTKNMPPVEVEVPHEPGNYMTFKPVAGKQIDDCKAGSIRDLSTSLPSEARKAIRELSPTDVANVNEKAKKELEENPLAGYSDSLLLTYGLVSWRGANYDGDPCDDAHKDDLEAETREWAARQVLKVSRITKGEARSSEPGSDQMNGSEPIHLRTSAASVLSGSLS